MLHNPLWSLLWARRGASIPKRLWGMQMRNASFTLFWVLLGSGSSLAYGTFVFLVRPFNTFGQTLLYIWSDLLIYLVRPFNIFGQTLLYIWSDKNDNIVRPDCWMNSSAMQDVLRTSPYMVGVVATPYTHVFAIASIVNSLSCFRWREFRRIYKIFSLGAQQSIKWCAPKPSTVRSV